MRQSLDNRTQSLEVDTRLSHSERDLWRPSREEAYLSHIWWCRSRGLYCNIGPRRRASLHGCSSSRCRSRSSSRSSNVLQVRCDYDQVTGHMLPLSTLVRLGLGGVCDQLTELVRRIRALRLDASEYTCLKFVILLNPGN